MDRRSNRADKPRAPRPNPLDAARITYIDYKDTDLLRKFISDRGKIRSRMGDPGQRPAAAATGARDQERPGDGAASLLFR